jgi:hypothetical protein
METVGIDIGKGYIKVWTPEEKHILPSQAARGSVTDLDGRSSSLVYRGVPYIFGSDAELGEGEWSSSDEKATMKSVLCVLKVIDEYFRDVQAIQVGVGLPVGNYEAEKAALKELLAGKHVYQSGRKTREVMITSSVIPEGIGAYCSLILDDEGMIREDYRTGTTLVVDIGFKTLDTVVVDGAKISMKGWGSVLLGVEKVVKYVAEELRRKLGILLPEEIVRIKECLENCDGDDWMPVCFLKGQNIDISPYMNDALAGYCGEVMTYIHDLVRQTVVRHILFTGGGSILLGKHLKETYPQAMFTGDIHANAEGFYKLAVRKKRQALSQTTVQYSQ